MTLPSDLPDTLSLFPLSGALLLPRTRLPLHLFEPRYLALLDDALKTPGRLIGMVQPAGSGDVPRLNRVGCAGRVVSFSETDEGTYLVSLRAVSRFRLGDEVEGFAPYRRARVSWGDYAADRSKTAQTDPAMDRTALMGLVRRYFQARGQEAEWDLLDQANDEMLVNACAMMAPLPPQDKQALLEAPDLVTRRKTLTALMEFALHKPRRKEDPLQ